MATFDFANNSSNENGSQVQAEGLLNGNLNGGLNPNRLREECIIALKVYDACRQLR